MNDLQLKRSGLALILLGVGMALIGLVAARFLSSRSLFGLGIANYQAVASPEDRPAPDFRMPSLRGGGAISLSAFRGEVVVLNFWASWCTPCRLEAPGLEQTWKDYRDRGVQFLGMDERDNNPAGISFQDEFGITYPSAVDPAGSLADDYALIGLPTTLVIDPNGQIRFRFIGYVDAQSLRKVLDPVLQGAER